MNSDEAPWLKDGIREAICELRFETQNAPEITIGRLTDADAWAGFEQVRLATADVPEQLRAAEEALRFAPSYQLNQPGNAGRFVRVGANVVSCHTAAPYPGWAVFGPSVRETLNALYGTLRGVAITRVGFRYVNALSKDAHAVGGPGDLNIDIVAGSDRVADTFVLVYAKELSDTHNVQVTVSTPAFVQAPPGASFDMLIDIDVTTSDGSVLTNSDRAFEWIERAHTLLKKEFFRLIPVGVMDKLKG